MSLRLVREKKASKTNTCEFLLQIHFKRVHVRKICYLVSYYKASSKRQTTANDN